MFRLCSVVLYALCSIRYNTVRADVSYKTILIDRTLNQHNCIQDADSVLVCRSFSRLNKSCIRNSTQIVVTGKFSNLSTVFAFENVVNLTLGGDMNASNVVLRCETGVNAGFIFKNVQDVSISNIIIENCGILFNSSSSMPMRTLPLMFRAALYVQTCTNVLILETDFQYNKGIGLVMYNTRGNVTIKKSLFKDNVPHNGEIGGGGLYVELNSCPYWLKNIPTSCLNTTDYSSNSVYIIENCVFIGNQAHANQTYVINGGFRTFGQGGGLLITPQENTTNNFFYIRGCRFHNNSAVWGGGLHLFLARSNSSYQNKIFVNDTLFENNESKEGGGGMTIYYYLKHHEPQIEIRVHKCNFTSNHARHGGGVLVLISTHTVVVKRNSKVVFEDCVWKNNSAIFSSAVDVTGNEGFAGVVFLDFSKCCFVSNRVCPISKMIYDPSGRHATVTHYGNSAFLVTSIKVHFTGYAHFIDNKGTALTVSAGVASFSNNMIATFTGNKGVRGGAISLLSSAYLKVRTNSTFSFVENKASIRGGAIYSSTIGQHDLHEHISALGCFIHVVQWYGNTASNVKFVFSQNDVDGHNSNHGNSIFASSLLSCASSCSSDYSNISAEDALRCIAKFEFSNSTAQNEVSSSGFNFVLTDALPLVVIPGKIFTLPLVITDALHNMVHSTLRAYVKSNSNITIDSAYTFISEKSMKLYGMPGDTCQLVLERVGYRTIDMQFTVSLAECPPGFVMDRNACVCASSINQDYPGIEKCRDSLYQAFILRGYWVGYDSNNASEDTLLTAHCPLNFCTYDSGAIKYYYELPAIANSTHLNNFICDEKRTGLLCGKCLDNHSVYFHSPDYKCGPNSKCSIGPLLYFISELIPLLILFLIIIIFDIKFTSGKYNGFIFFAQVVDYIAVDAPEVTSIQHSQWVQSINSVSLFIYRVFNLRFFSFDSLSFCLWRGAEMLDIITFKFVTILFAFFLVVVVYMLLNVFNYNRFCRLWSKRLSVIHGLSTFLVMCYALCVQISFQILTPRRLFGKGGKVVHLQVLYSGDIVFFSKHHAIYAIPAVLCIAAIVVIPTLLLLWYPSGQRLLGLCKISETRCMKLIDKLIPVHRIQPFLDSFQGCFKDNFRFFAGLYLAYRLCILACEFFSVDRTQFYVMIETVFVVILLAHSMAQPYRKKSHNVVDSILIAILALINASSLFIYTHTTEIRFLKGLYVLSVFRSLFVALPLVGVSVYFIAWSGIIAKTYILRKCLKSRPESVLDEFPARMLDDFSNESYNSSYRKLKNETLNTLKTD